MKANTRDALQDTGGQDSTEQERSPSDKRRGYTTEQEPSPSDKRRGYMTMTFLCGTGTSRAQPTEREKIFTSYAADKGPTSRVYKELPLNTKAVKLPKTNGRIS